MLGRHAANITDSQRKLQDIERQLKAKLGRAKEIASQGSLDEFTEKTQQQLIQDLEVPRQLIKKIELPLFDPSLNYTEHYWQTYLQNQINCALICEANQKKTALNQLISQIEDLQDEYYRINRLKNRKKNRRMASQIEKIYLCPYDKCQRLYGSDVSLNLHIKIKHNGGNKTDRQKLAVTVAVYSKKYVWPKRTTKLFLRSLQAYLLVTCGNIGSCISRRSQEIMRGSECVQDGGSSS